MRQKSSAFKKRFRLPEGELHSHISMMERPQKRAFTLRARRDSNPRSFESESNTLSTELRAHTFIIAQFRNDFKRQEEISHDGRCSGTQSIMRQEQVFLANGCRGTLIYRTWFGRRLPRRERAVYRQRCTRKNDKSKNGCFDTAVFDHATFFFRISGAKPMILMRRSSQWLRK